MIPFKSIEHLARSAGFDAAGASPAANVSPKVSERLKGWIDAGMHASMSYMERNLPKRMDPCKLVPNAKSIISVAVSYNPGNPSISTTPPRISRYALSIDYHTTIKRMLFDLVDSIRREYGPATGRAFVDSAPVLDRSWAERSGLGWIGKNSMLISQQLGSYIFIGELIVDIEVEPSVNRAKNRCGNCTRCMDACPTNAIVEPGVIDSRRCISYLTIEAKGMLPPEHKGMLNGWCFGCDICQEVCPWNKRAPKGSSPYLKPLQPILDLTPQHLQELTEQQFIQLFKGTPLERTGYSILMDRVAACTQE